MISNFKPYAEYKQSSSRWLAAVPHHWEVRKLRTLIRSRKERGRPDLPLLSVAREKGVFVRSLTDEEENHNVIPEDLSNYKVAHAGDLVINKMKAWQGSMGITPCDGIVSPAYFVFEFNVANCAFGQALLRSKPYVAHFGQASDGVRVGQWDLSIAGMREIPVLLPPPDEQEAIVRFLDWFTARIEKAIRSKKKLIKLLNEQKQAIIHKAVTRGLDSSVELKPSGIPWLGEIPEHWEVSRGKFLFEEVDVRSDKGLEELLTVSSSDGVVPRSSRTVLMFKATSYVGYKLCWPGDLVVNSLWAWARGLGFSEYHGIVSTAYGVYRLRDEYRGRWKYLHELLRSQAYDWEFHVRSKGIWKSRLQLTDESFLDMRIVVPPEAEAIRIVDHIRNLTRSLSSGVSQLEREIALLQEYQMRLTADVVTGKLDVREVASHLTTEPEALAEPIENEELINNVEIQGAADETE